MANKLDLEFFKNLLLEEKSNIEDVIRMSANEVKDLIDDNSNTDEADFAFVSSNSMIREAISIQQQKELKEVEIALKKIENGTYGICEMCEEEIAFDRLKVKPHSRYCIACRGIVEIENKKAKS